MENTHKNKEIILHLAIPKNSLNYKINLSSKSDESSDEFSENSFKLQSELNDKNSTIKNLQSELEKYKTSDVIKPIVFNNNTQNLNTKSACWWCTRDGFDKNYVQPNRYLNNDKYEYINYNGVVGIFCTPNCAFAYSNSLNDGRHDIRRALFYKLYDISDEIKIVMAKSRYELKKFGGTLDRCF